MNCNWRTTLRKLWTTGSHSGSIWHVPRSIREAICFPRSHMFAHCHRIQSALHEHDCSPTSLPTQYSIPMTILGISLGTTVTGIAILKDEALIEWNNHVYPQAWSDNKMRIILKQYKRYIARHNVNAVVVKIPPTKKQTTSMLLKAIEKLAKKHGCAFDITSKREIKGFFTLKNTDALIEYAQIKYPKLRNTYLKSIATNHRYHKKLYEAVLSADVYQERQRVRALQIANTKE
jgi:RNase H-fold protein (predicted Holliday junction resolvase)